MSSTEETMSESRAVPTPTAAPNKSGLQFTGRTKYVARLLRLLTPKVKEGLIFTTIDLAVTNPGGEAEPGDPPNLPDRNYLRSVHCDKTGSYFHYLSAALGSEGPLGYGEVGIEDVERLLSCIDSGLFGETVELRASDSRLVLKGGGATTQVGVVPISRVPRATSPEPYGFGPNGLPIRTSSKHRPAPGSDWIAWAKAGYAVLGLQKTHVEKILAAGHLMAERHGQTVLIRFDQVDGILTVQATPAGSRNAAVADPVSVELGDLSQRVTSDRVNDFRFATMFNGLESILGNAIRDVQGDEPTVFVYHPDEPAANFLSQELVKDDGGPILQLGQTAAGWAGEPKKTPRK